MKIAAIIFAAATAVAIAAENDLEKIKAAFDSGDAARARNAALRAASIGKDAVPVLKEAISKDQTGWAAIGLADIKDPATLDAVLACLKPGAPNASALAYHLGAWHDPKVVAALLGTVQAPDPALAAWSLRGLARQGVPLPVDVVDKLLAADDAKVRGTVVDALDESKTAGSFPLLSRVARTDKEPRVRAAAVRAVADGGLSREAGDLLVAALDDANDTVFVTALNAIIKLSKEKMTIFHPRNDGPEVKAKSTAEAKRWWEKNRAKYK